MLLFPLLAALDAAFWWLYGETVTVTGDALISFAAFALAFSVFIWCIEEATSLALSSLGGDRISGEPTRV